MDWHNPRHWQNPVHLEWRHGRRFRNVLLALAGVVLLIGWLPYWISSDALKAFLVNSIATDTGRTLRIDGRARAVLLPRPALLLEQVSLSEAGQPQQLFAKADSLTARIDFWSLLQWQPKLRELLIRRPELRVVRREDGHFNFDDLLQLEGSGIRIALDAVRFDDARFSMTDEFFGQRISSRALDVNLENLSDPKNGRLTASGVLQFGPNDETRFWQGELQASAAMRYVEKERRLHIAELQVDVAQQGDSAPALQMRQGKISITGKLDFGWRPLAFEGGELEMRSSGLRAGQRWQSTLKIPEIRYAGEVLAMHRLKLAVNMNSQTGSLVSSLEIPTLAGTRQVGLRTDSAWINVELNSPQQHLALNFSSPLEVHRNSEIRLPAYRLNGNYSNRSLPRGAIQLNLQGQAMLDLHNEFLSLDNVGVLDQAPLSAKIIVENFVEPAYQLDVSLARLDLTPYLPAVTEEAKAVDPERPFDFWWLEGLNATGQIRIDELILQKMHINQLDFKLAARDRKLVLDPLEAQLYGGQLSGRFELDASKPEASVRLRQRLTRMNVNTLMSDVLGTQRFEGFGSVDLDVATVGDRMSDLRRTAGGSVRLMLDKGAIRGLDIPAALRVLSQQVKAINGEEIRLADLNARTSFSRLNASFVLRHGVASNEDLSLDAGGLILHGNGEVNFADGSIDYTGLASPNPRVPELAGLRGLIVPIHIRGPLDKPVYAIDYTSVREQIERQQLVVANASASAGKKGRSR